jgi:hypothetical protein
VFKAAKQMLFGLAVYIKSCRIYCFVSLSCAKHVQERLIAKKAVAKFGSWEVTFCPGDPGSFPGDFR